jgi:uncharacterized protein (DUF362 family)
MDKTLVEKTKEREKFIKKAFLWGEIFEKIKEKKKILLKPNIVSSEGYPTTTHPESLKVCLELILKVKPSKEIIVADGPAFDAGNSDKILKNHPLKKICDEFGIPLINLNTYPKKKVKIQNYTFHIARLALEADFIISLPVLKVHRICQITGALKNQYGFLSPKQKLFYHLPFKNINKAIVLLNKIIKVDFFIVDAIKTLISAQEKRHGGKEKELGYMLSGFDPLDLDMKGFEFLKKIAPKLKKKTINDIAQFKFAKEILV